MTDAQFSAWLADRRATRCVLVEIDYAVLATGATGTEYLATVPYVSGPGDAPRHQTYRAIVKAIPAMRQTLSELFNGRSVPNLGSVEIFSADAATDAWLFDRDWIGRGMRLFLGAPTWAKVDFRKVWSGVVGDVGLTNTNTLAFQARDAKHTLNAPVKVPTATVWPNAARPYPLCYGTCTNVAPVLVAARPGTYQIHDGPIKAIDAIYMNGVPFTTANINLDLGQFTIPINQVTGQVTCDVRGAVIAGAMLTTAAEILYDVAVRRGPLTADRLNVAAIAEKCPQALGLYVAGEDFADVYALMDSVVQSVGGYYATDLEGNVFVDRVDFSGAPVLTIVPEQLAFGGLKLERIYQPLARITLGYGKQWTEVKAPASTLTENLREFLGSAQSLAVTVDNPNLARFGRTRDLGTIDTLLTTADDTLAEATRRMAIWGAPRARFALDTFAAGYTLKIGDAVTLKHPRYGLALGRTGIVVDMLRYPSSMRATLAVLI